MLDCLNVSDTLDPATVVMQLCRNLEWERAVVVLCRCSYVCDHHSCFAYVNAVCSLAIAAPQLDCSNRKNFKRPITADLWIKSKSFWTPICAQRRVWQKA